MGQGPTVEMAATGFTHPWGLTPRVAGAVLAGTAALVETVRQEQMLPVLPLVRLARGALVAVEQEAPLQALQKFSNAKADEVAG